MIAALIMLLVLLFTKHFVVDFPLQGPWNYKNKGIYGHPGGLSHSLGHALFTSLCLMIVTFSFNLGWDLAVVLGLGIFDGVIHYHVDWAKIKIRDHFGWGPTTHEEFWYLTGLDQWLHALTYLAIAIILFM